MPLLPKKRPPATLPTANQIVLAAAAKARVELLLGEMDRNLRDLRHILVEERNPDGRHSD